MIICVDFDGTCVTHDFPEVGKDIGAQPVLRRWVQEGHKLVLFTMRSGHYLQSAVDWFEQNEIPLYGINRNPTQDKWTASPKAYGQMYIDDAALGCPLVYGMHSRPFVDWAAVEEKFINNQKANTMINADEQGDNPEITEGQYLVGISFNPGGNEHVNEVKRRAAELIDYVREHGKDPRTAAMAASDFEVGAMNAVKSVTKPERPAHLS